MSLLLAPYNNAMRLGMGFNSYTQTLCVNDVVQKPNGVKASEDDLRATSIVDGPKAVTEVASAGVVGGSTIAENSGTTIITRTDGQTGVSQTVMWKAEFVDKISEITDSMNISGSLAIKVDAIGGGAEAEGHFLDSSKFKESDINYLIQVKVTNQKLIADDVTQFAPIRNVQPGDFTAVYGDSYISGFLEGGVFNALVSVKLKDKSKVRDFGGMIKVDLNFTGVSVGGSAKGGKQTSDTSMDSETTISVSWSGGGDIKPDNIKDWDIASLKSVAMEFPDMVARCPQRTSAILTKYTGLRSYYEQNVKGSPLDYENAGVYASALLDAYMDYKSLWKTMQTAIWEVDNGISKLESQETSPEMDELAAQSKGNFEQRMTVYKTEQDAEKNLNQMSVARGNAGLRIKEKAPLEPNPLVPYKASMFGLDKAKRDCRFEMIKIVHEVDAVTNDPKVAIDPGRTWQYLSPVIFRKLVPLVRSMSTTEGKEDPVELRKTLDSMTKAWESSKEMQKKTEMAYDKANSELKKAKDDTEDIKKQLDAANSERDAAKKLQNDVEKAHEQYKSLEAQMQSQKGRENALAEAKATLERAALAWGARQNSWRNDRVQIYFILYGGIMIWDDNVARRLLEKAESQNSFEFTDEFMGCDPWPGVFKSGSVNYRYHNAGEMRCLVGKQGQQVRFDPL